MNRIMMIGEMTVRDLVRRRTVVGLLFALPLLFYLARHDSHTGQAVRFVLIGLGFTSSAAGLFATISARSLEFRLRLSGYRTADIYLGRLIAVVAIGLVIAVPYQIVIMIDQNVPREGAVGLTLALTVLVGAPLGMLLGSAIPRDMEGVLLLLGVTSMQFLMDPAKTAGRFMPFWSAREIGTYAIDLTGPEYLRRGLLHATVYGAILFIATATIAGVRLRRRGHVHTGTLSHHAPS